MAAAFAFPDDPEDELVGNGGMRPPVTEKREAVLALEPGRKGEDTLGEWPIAACRVEEVGRRGESEGDGDRGLSAGDPSPSFVVLSGLGLACANNRESEEGPAVRE